MTSIYDDKAIRGMDASNMAAHLFGFPGQLREGAELYHKAPCNHLRGEVQNVVLTGMGGSAIGADMLRSLVEGEIGVPVVVVRGYRLPAFVGRGTLLIGVSYSGNTEETLSSFGDGLEKGATGYVVTCGGKLGELAESRGIPCTKVPGGMMPRSSLGYLFVPLLLALADAKLISHRDRDLEEAADVLVGLRGSYGPDSTAEKNPAKKLAVELQGKVAVIYGSAGGTEPVAQRWKTGLNENSKAYAAFNAVPEMNHNEIVGWDAQPELSAKTAAVFLRDRDDHPAVSKRVELNQIILRGKGLAVHEVWSQGESRLARLFSLVYLGDYVSYYLALLYGIDPTPVEIIEKLKRNLTQQR